MNNNELRDLSITELLELYVKHKGNANETIKVVAQAIERELLSRIGAPSPEDTEKAVKRHLGVNPFSADASVNPEFAREVEARRKAISTDKQKSDTSCGTPLEESNRNVFILRASRQNGPSLSDPAFTIDLSQLRRLQKGDTRIVFQYAAETMGAVLHFYIIPEFLA